jgi:hypothetical protein
VRPTTRLVPAVLAVLGSLALVACSPLPDSGPVELGEGPAPTASAAPFDFNPPGPVAGADRAEITAGFLRALQGTPVGTTVAEEFMTSDAAASWRPDELTVVYSGQRIVVRPGSTRVAVQLEETFALDSTGRWIGAGVRGGSERTLDFRFARVDGEWRITGLPDALVIPYSHFEARYREYTLPFFDATGSVLVSEQVYLPWGVQAPTLLVSSLLSGPGQAQRVIERTFFPRGTRLGVGVPVREDGVAEVPLSRHMLDLGEDQLDLAMAQLAWALGQVSEVEAFQVTVDGTPLELPGGQNVADVDDWPEYAPTVASAPSDLFGVRADAVVQVVDSSEIAAAALPKALTRPRSLGVDLAGQQFAIVPSSGDRVVQVPRTAEGSAPPTTVFRGTDVLRPMWDHVGRLWLVDRTATGPRVLVRHYGAAEQIPAPGLGGARVLAAALSRDGTRLVLALAGPGPVGDRLVMLRVVRNASGEPLRLTRPQEIATPQPLLRSQDVGWRDPTTVAVLTRPSRTTTEVVLASADGSSGRIDLDSELDVLFEPGVTLAASPAAPAALMVAARDGGLHALDVQGRWDLDALPSGLRVPAFVG